MVDRVMADVVYGPPKVVMAYLVMANVVYGGVRVVFKINKGANDGCCHGTMSAADGS